MQAAQCPAPTCSGWGTRHGSRGSGEERLQRDHHARHEVQIPAQDRLTLHARTDAARNASVAHLPANAVRRSLGSAHCAGSLGAGVESAALAQFDEREERRKCAQVGLLPDDEREHLQVGVPE